MENRSLRPDSSKGLSHLISVDAFKAVLADVDATEKLREVEAMSFREARVFRIYPGEGATAMVEVTAGAKKKYKDHFINIQNPLIRDVGVTCAFEADDTVLGYIPHYSFASDVFGDEIMYAFFHKHIDAVVMLMATRADGYISATQVMHSMAEPIPFGKLCAWCGGRTWGPKGGEEKLKKCPCKTVRYCSKECQYAHWADHRPCCSRGV
jgi:hypothetical protein